MLPWCGVLVCASIRGEDVADRVKFAGRGESMLLFLGAATTGGEDDPPAKADAGTVASTTGGLVLLPPPSVGPRKPSTGGDVDEGEADMDIDAAAAVVLADTSDTESAASEGGEARTRNPPPRLG